MQLIVDDTDCVMILMPAQIPGSIGKLLSEGLQNFGVRVIEYGLPGFFPGPDGRCDDGEVDEIIDIIKREGVTSVVALPTHIKAVAEAARRKSESPQHAAERGVCAGGGRHALRGKFRMQGI